MARADAKTVRHLVLVLGDQLSHTSPAFEGFNATQDRVLLIEAPGEATHVWSHVARIAIFLSAMRHFAEELRKRGLPVDYVKLDDARDEPSLAGRLRRELARLAPGVLRLVEPGEWRLEQSIRDLAREAGVALQLVDDTHFLCSRADFARWAGPGRRSLRLEFFYREMRRRHGVLMDAEGGPAGGRWNFDTANRKPFPKSGPGLVPAPEAFPPDAMTKEVIADVRRVFGDHPGSLDHFAWAVTRDDALKALHTFIEARLAGFGEHQDAMWTGTPFGWHSLLSSALNLHLLDPREVVAAVEAAWRRGETSLESAEGFIRQVIGWREFMRGVYWLDMPGMASANHYDHHRPLPGWYWTGKTKMACAAAAIGQTLEHGYAHHIQRLMVTGLFALLAEIEPSQVADWYLAVYVDAVEWAELPNVSGMALYADGGRYTSKPYVASGAYIQRMSDYCARCTYAPTQKEADGAGKPLCPYTALYWHFLDRHEAELAANPRTVFMARNLARLSGEERARRRQDAEDVLARLEAL